MLTKRVKTDDPEIKVKKIVKVAETKKEGFFLLQEKYLRFAGLQRHELIKYPLLLNCIVFFGWSCNVLTIISEIAFIILSRDVLESADAAGPLLSISTTLFKILIFFASKETFYMLVEEVKNMSTGARSSENIIQANKLDQRMTFTYFTSTWLTGLGLIIAPIIMYAIKRVLGKDDLKMDLPFKAEFPFDTSSFPVFELIFAMHCIAAYSTVITTVAVDSIAFGLCVHISAHFEILRDSFDGNKVKFVRTHQRQIDLSNRLNQLIRPIVFVEFVIGALYLCVLGFQLLMNELFVKKFIAAVYIFAVLVQLSVYSYGGQLIMSSSASVADNLEGLDKDYVIIIARAQKPSSLNAWFYKADLPTFQILLSSAASIFTVLKSALD